MQIYMYSVPVSSGSLRPPLRLWDTVGFRFDHDHGAGPLVQINDTV